jgi:membrane carboxypeptidase/penicillin-binding protein PbpC
MLGCADLLASLPHALVPHLDGLKVDGEIGGRVQLSGDADDAGTLALDVTGLNGCRARTDGALADVASLVRADAPALVGHVVDGRPLPLVARSPSWRALDSLPPSVVRAFLVAEDGRFFLHHGFDVDRIGHALAADLDAGRFDRGASTITQQVAKNLWLGGERTVGRKLEEAVLTWRLEQVLDKRRILELYMNLVELGPGVYGVQDASERYFGKLPDELSADEAAQLAALLPAPRRGMDGFWQKRYQALAARMPSEHVVMPAPPVPPSAPVKLSRR